MGHPVYITACIFIVLVFLTKLVFGQEDIPHCRPDKLVKGNKLNYVGLYSGLTPGNNFFPRLHFFS
jgi:hypothetical protein